MEEILTFKARECEERLSVARSNVLEEIHKLDHSADDSFSHVNKIFDLVTETLERRREEWLNKVKMKKNEKKKILENQLEEIENHINAINSEQNSDPSNDIR